MRLIGDDEQLTGRKDKEDQVIDLIMSPIKREIPSFETQDPLVEVNLGTIDEPRLTKVSGFLS